MGVPDLFGFRTVTEHYGHLTIYQSHCRCFQLHATVTLHYPAPIATTILHLENRGSAAPQSYLNSMGSQQVIIVGGGAAGFFAAIACAEAATGNMVTILEKGPAFLTKVLISGGGRCNLTHACFDPREFATRFPRGERELIGPFQRFGAIDTVAWFKAHGVTLNTEHDGRMFPLNNKSQTIVDCLTGAAKAAGVKLVAHCGVERVTRHAQGL